MKINSDYCGISFDVFFDESDKVCLFLSPSGTGKTFLFNVLVNQLNRKGVCTSLINSIILNSLHNDIERLQDNCLDKTVRIVILDNADLYLTQPFLDALMDNDKTVIISLKDERRFQFREHGFYKVMYDSDSLVVRRKKWQ